MPLVLAQAAAAPVELEIPPEPANPIMIQPVPEVTVVIPTPPPPKQPPRKKPAPAKEAQPPAQVASAAEPAALAIGSLSNGGESTPQSQQQTKDLIAAIRRRLAALPARTASRQKSEISQVNRFLKQAQQALDSGDAEGANNLAVKAKLLMDDVEKK
jgi:protein TonB